MRIFVEDSFDSAHFLPNVPPGHKCGTMHGHTYRVRLIVEGPVDPRSGWVVDYAAVKAAWEHVRARIDHQCLNDVLMSNPTCELIAEWIGAQLPMVTGIELRETERAGVIWTR